MTGIPQLRTSDGRFDGVPGYPWAARYTSELPSPGGLRLHCVDDGPRDAHITWPSLHGNPQMSEAECRSLSSRANGSQDRPDRRSV